MDTALSADGADDLRPSHDVPHAEGPTPMAQAASTLSGPLTRDRDGGVDAALAAWRTETVERRAVWDLRAAQAEADRLLRRARTFGVLGVSAGLGMAGAALLAVGVWLAVPTGASAAPLPSSSTRIPGAIGGGASIHPVRTEGTPGAAAETPAAVGLLGEPLTWTTVHGGLFVQADYADGAPMVLRWTDAAGNPVLEPTPCVNAVSAEVGRCYVGRSARRVRAALDAGAASGTWTASACRGGLCAEVGRWDVR